MYNLLKKICTIILFVSWSLSLFGQTENPLKIIKVADSLFYAGNFLAAEGLYLEALGKYPTDSIEQKVLLMASIGDCRFKQRNYKGAITYYYTTSKFASESFCNYHAIRSQRNLGIIYSLFSLKDSAFYWLRRAQAIAFGCGHSKIACGSLKEIGKIFYNSGMLDSAEKYFNMAKNIAAEKGLLSFLSEVDYELGSLFMDKGDYKKALAVYMEMDSCEKVLGRTDFLAHTANSIGNVYSEWGWFDKALEMQLKAIEICREQKDSVNLGVFLANLGNSYASWNQNEKALDYYEESNALLKIYGTDNQIALSYINLGSRHSAMGNLNKAIQYFDSALSIQRRIKDNLYISTTYNNIGSVYLLLNKTDSAYKYFYLAYQSDSTTGRDNTLPYRLQRLGLILAMMNQTDKAEFFAQKGLEHALKISKQEAIADGYSVLGKIYLYKKDFTRAAEAFEKGMKFRVQMVSNSPVELKREYLSSQNKTSKSLVLSHFLSGKKEKTIEAIESSKSQVLKELLFKHSLVSRRVLETSFRQIMPDEVFIRYCFVPTGLLAIVSTNKRDTIVQLHPVSIDSVLYENSESFLEISNVEIYRYLQNISFQQREDSLKFTASKLYNKYFRPLQKLIGDKKKITIFPDEYLTLLPFETLVDEKGQYLIQSYDFRYAQSQSILNYLRSIKNKSKSRQLLAIGGANYEPGFILNIPEIPLNSQSAKYYRRKAEQLSATESSFQEIYHELGFGNWSNIPGTESEIEGIRKWIANITILKGSDASENKIKTLAKSGQLGEYSIIHFATHGLVIPDIPQLAALVLDQNNISENSEDGFLRMDEISELPLNADLTVLSACETGLGKLYSNEGILGITYAFFLAGSRSVITSLWQVSDNSTTELMINLYKNLTKNNTSYSDALNQTKRDFINNKYFKQWQHPYYWAPFVYYGF